jgi:hypothetical protein
VSNNLYLEEESGLVSGISKPCLHSSATRSMSDQCFLTISEKEAPSSAPSKGFGRPAFQYLKY